MSFKSKFASIVKAIVEGGAAVAGVVDPAALPLIDSIEGTTTALVTAIAPAPAPVVNAPPAGTSAPATPASSIETEVAELEAAFAQLSGFVLKIASTIDPAVATAIQSALPAAAPPPATK